MSFFNLLFCLLESSSSNEVGPPTRAAHAKTADLAQTQNSCIGNVNQLEMCENGMTTVMPRTNQTDAERVPITIRDCPFPTFV